MDGPRDELPWQPSNRNYSMLEWTPLTAGVTYTRDVTYNGAGDSTYHAVKTIGGYVEPFAFGGQAGPSLGLPSGQSTGYLTVPGNDVFCDLAMATGTSSYADGNDAAAGTDLVVQRSAGNLSYWSPAAADPQSQFTNMAVGDGAGVSNTDLISLLVRDVASLIAFVNTDAPLQNSTHWDPTASPNVTTSDIDFTVPAWFGIIAQDLNEIDEAGYDLVNSQVFETNEFVPLAVALQKAQAEGNGLVVNMTHTTVDNYHYGVVGGRKVNVLWFYLGSRVINWEKQLSHDMQALVIPATDPYNQAVFIDYGPFKNFPGV